MSLTYDFFKNLLYLQKFCIFCRKVPSKRQAAPFNTTQFIMNDHGDTIQYLDEKFGVTGNSENNPSDGDPVRRRISRARESSFR